MCFPLLTRGATVSAPGSPARQQGGNFVFEAKSDGHKPSVIYHKCWRKGRDKTPGGRTIEYGIVIETKY